MVNAGAIAKLVRLLDSTNSDVREQSVWALGNIAGDSIQTRGVLSILAFTTCVCKLLLCSCQWCTCRVWVVSTRMHKHPFANAPRAPVRTCKTWPMKHGQLDNQVTQTYTQVLFCTTFMMLESWHVRCRRSHRGRQPAAADAHACRACSCAHTITLSFPRKASCLGNQQHVPRRCPTAK